MKIIQLDGQPYNLPERWEEIDPERLPRLIELLYLVPESGSMYHELIKAALNIRPKVWVKMMQKHFGNSVPKPVRTANAAVLSDIVQMLRWLWTQPMQTRPFESVLVGPQSYYLPEEQFRTMSYGELTDAYIHLTTFVRQLIPGDEHLNYLVATLCRPEREATGTDADWNGDRREPYNEYVSRDRISLISHVPFEERMAVMLYFASTVKGLMEQYAVFAPAAETVEDVAEEDYPGQSFMKNQHLLAEKGIFGTMQETKKTNAHEVLLFLEEHRKDLLAQIEQQRKHQNAY